MFSEEETSQIINFLNSIIRSGKVNDFFNLYKDAVEELSERVPRLALLYKCYLSFEGEES